MTKRELAIGQEFHDGLGDKHRITDVGRRTVLTLNVTQALADHDDDPSWLDDGPPYALVEHVFDESEYPILAESFDVYRWLQRCPNSPRGHSLEWLAESRCDYCGKQYPDGVHGREYIEGASDG